MTRCIGKRKVLGRMEGEKKRSRTAACFMIKMVWLGATLSALAAAAVVGESAGDPIVCSLNGQQHLGVGPCVCDPGWAGKTCANLAVAPSRVLWPQLADGDPRTRSSSSLSWGGSVLYDGATKLWHGWFNAGCQTNTSFMHTYITGAVHAVSTDVKGPYSFASVSVQGELECPMSISDGDGGVLIAYLDHGLPNGSALNLQMPCFGASNGSMKGATPRPAGPYPRKLCATLQPEPHVWPHVSPADPNVEGRRLGIASAPSPDGPWTYIYPKVAKPDYNATSDSDMECGINPSLHRLANGTWLLALRYGGTTGSHLVMATAPAWGGPYTLVSSGAQWAPGVATEGSEDPFVWKNARGFHMIHHDGAHGRHVFSLDGMQWDGYPEASKGPETDAYNMTILFDDGLSVTTGRRERPWLMLDTNGHPLFLVTGCESNCHVVNKQNVGCRSYTVMTPLLPLGRTPASDASL